MHSEPRVAGPLEETLKAHGLDLRLCAQVLLESSGRGCLVADRNGAVVLVNDLGRERLGLAAGARLNEALPELAPRVAAVLAGAPDPGGPSLQRSARPVQASVHALGGAGVLCLFRDPAPGAAGYTELARERDAILDSLADGVWIVDNQGCVLRLNPAAERMNGVTAEEVVGRNVRDLVAEGLFDRSVALEVIKRKGPVSMMQKGRGGRVFLLTGTPVVDDQGRIVRVVTTERGGAEIERLIQELEDQDRLQATFPDLVPELPSDELFTRQVIAKSPCMRMALGHAIKVSKAGSTALILGESGVGKELFADIIYKYSGLQGKPFVKLNCGAIPESLLEAELFGYERGAFTGAQAKGKPGLLELADGGMLFLDEVAELTLSAQVKLLRILEDGRLTRVGGTQSRKINVRILAATHKNLREMVASGAFRLDLYYRLSVIPIYIPPLRERTECILPLLHHFVDLFDARVGVRRRFSRETTAALLAYAWPGNVRELANLCERVVVMSESEVINLRDLPSEILPARPVPVPGAGGEESLDMALKNTERAMLLDVRQHHRTQAQMAKALGVNQSTIARKLKKYNIQ
jgi:PAS domain S-box-containing protein